MAGVTIFGPILTRFSRKVVGFQPPIDPHSPSPVAHSPARMIWSQTLSLIVTGEMGWTPKLNRQGDRDPWGNSTPLVLASSGLKMGQVIGRSDGQGGAPATELYTPANLLATVMHYLFDVPKLRVRTDLSRDLKEVIANGKPIAQR
jgi:hypothetical protein